MMLRRFKIDFLDEITCRLDNFTYSLAICWELH
jgi:hypothetical protein